MTRKSKSKVAENEANMQLVLKDWKKNKNQTITAMAERYKVSRIILNNRIKGRKSRRESRQKLQVLTSVEENELVRWISILTFIGFSSCHALVRQMAEALRKRRTRGVNDESISVIEYSSLGNHWVRNFLERHPSLATVIGRRIEKTRIEGTRPEALQKWFEAFQKEIIDDSNVIISNVYNMDESGFSIGIIKAGRVIINKEIRIQFQAQPGRQE